MGEAKHKNTCGNCKFYHRDGANLQQGNCVRYPPTLAFVAAGGGLGKFTAYPEVKPIMPACGEHVVALALTAA